MTFLLGLWMNWSFASHNKPNWTNLHALRNLVGFQLTANMFNIAVHQFLLIPWPFWGYAVNPGHFLWTINPVACRTYTVIADLISISCAANATSIFVTSLGKQDLRQERQRKVAFCLVLAIFCLGGVSSVVYTELLPLIKHEALRVSNCPSHPFLLLCGQKQIKYAFTTYVTCSVILFWNIHHRSTSGFSESWSRNIINYFLKCLSVACQCTTICALMFAVVFIPAHILGGPLYSVTFNRVKLYFVIVTLAVSIGLPALLAQLHADGNYGIAGYPVESSFMERRSGTGQGHKTRTIAQDTRTNI